MLQGMRIQVIFFFFLFLLEGLQESKASEKPNIVFVMMDDFGFGQFAPHNHNLEVEDFDPLLLEHVREHNDYNPQNALRMSKRAVPTLSRMTRQGVMFTNAFTSSNLSAPSRMGIATGIHQNRWGIYRNIDCEAHGLKPGSHLAEQLKKTGYATAHIGKWHIGSRNRRIVADTLSKHNLPDTLSYWQVRQKYPALAENLKNNGYMGSVVDAHHPLNNGFDYYFGYNMWESPFYNATNVWENFKPAGRLEKYNTDLFTDKAMNFIRKSIKDDKPFYVQLHYHAVHAPLEPKAPDKYYNHFHSDSHVLNNFYAHVYAVDQSIHRIEQYLKERGMAENTLIVFTSDNGGAVGGRSCLPGNAPYVGQKGMYFQGGIRVPLIFYWPEGIHQRKVNHQLVSAMDILPTAIDAAGGKIPEDIDGKSLLPYLRGKSREPVRDHLVWSGIHARAWAFMSHMSFLPHLEAREKAPSAWAVVKKNYILRYIASVPPELWKDFPEGRDPVFELYNYNNDPQETKNLIDEEKPIVKDLQNIWHKRASSYPPPVRWNREKWEAIMPPNNMYRNQK
jgi:uncharacterized sulfatase